MIMHLGGNEATVTAYVHVHVRNTVDVAVPIGSYSAISTTFKDHYMYSLVTCNV